ncbi:hypothetical protein [Lutispora saccharofermentans]|uniref:Holin n=1 Tax=Lutispora saccharofermentans TaxID=3024236 RepID=A0ABT1NGM4_9FIRM|nr:hypothetical protein [Lutispora saccharofermentans]MCQ1530445.1 hypothetical protein [Lutispora saccharofermentans]
MIIVSILAVLVFDIATCYIEIPKMLQGKLYKELWTFSILLALGTALAILKSFEVDIPNPSDFIAWIYSPVADTVEMLLK